ncbi:transcriptional regulator, partial [Salmonella enterica subsp. enterica]|nr:transcriptional regulator [Salmonella enterica subsp. enterica]
MNLPALANTATTPNVFIHDGKAVTTSRSVGEYFRKLHKDVIRKIESLDCSPEFTGRNFTLSEYTDSTGRKLP